MNELRDGDYSPLEIQWYQLQAQRATAEQTKRIADILEDIARVMLSPSGVVEGLEQGSDT